MGKKNFDRAIFKEIDNLPDHYLEEINELCTKILLNVLLDPEKKSERDRNVALGATQKALGLLIGKCFNLDQLDIVIEQACAGLRYNAKLWSKDE